MPQMSKALDIRFREVVSFCEERLARSLCQSVSKTVSEIKAGRMPAFAVFTPSGARYLDLRGVRGNEFYIEPMKKEIHLTACHFAATSFQHNGGFQGVWR